MKTIKFLKTVVTVYFIFISFNAFTQNQAKLLKSKSFIKINGTSTIHDWEENVLQFESNARVLIQNSRLENIDNASFKCSAKSFESGNSLMNKKTYEALKANEHPELSFIPHKVTKIVSSDGHYSCVIEGTLSIAGVSRITTIPISGYIKNSNFTIEGSATINMTDFGIAPPTALMGTLKTGATITIIFYLSFLIS